ncbi:YciI family protein [Pseudoclavibacter caeni]|uniref:YCII-related domain-containing protein n=1 Tax=Pseudoclavibacter caeni TaxID=908846 RepID=A0A7C8BNE9_9MICO|nr:YciI family protein [Pseudoclavibacter caeni]KAB1632446.1 hypothetical protein F8O02_05460 [Pseudoclavibacter caeni]NYJ97701.1 hypothetical protein [Pseudoclavibacter caeni]
MSLYAVTYVYIDDDAALAATRPEHRAYLSGLQQNGQNLASGPLAVPGPNSALLILQADSIEQAAALSDDDPMVASGLVTERHIQAWNIVIGGLGD